MPVVDRISLPGTELAAVLAALAAETGPVGWRIASEEATAGLPGLRCGTASEGGSEAEELESFGIELLREAEM